MDNNQLLDRLNTIEAWAIMIQKEAAKLRKELENHAANVSDKETEINERIKANGAKRVARLLKSAAKNKP
jgi:hypothetical protein